MKYLHILCSILRNRISVNKSFYILRTSSSFFLKSSILSKQFHLSKVKFLHTDNESEELFESLPIIESEIDHKYSIRNSIFKNCQDDIITELNSCVSIEEVLNLVKKYINIYEDKHIVHTIFVLRDLQKIFFQYNGFNRPTANMFLETIKNNEVFYNLLSRIKDKLGDFDPDYLSYVFLHLEKLGLSIEDEFMQNVALKVRDNLLKHFYLDQCSRFLTVTFSENSVRPYYLSLPIVPLVIAHIEKCNSVDAVHNLTISLNRLHNLVTKELLEKYRSKISSFLENQTLKGSDFRTLLKIILFLNYPEWRDKNILLISDCISLLQKYIDQLNAEDLTTLYEVFFKNQEPGMVLNSIQRCSAKYLYELDEAGSTIDEITSLKLFSSLIYFSSPTHRIQFRKYMPKYLNSCHSYRGLVQLRKIFSYMKVSSTKLCANYWNLCLKILNEELHPNLIVNLCDNYMNFNTDVNSYRHYKLENRIVDYIKKSLQVDPFLRPSKTTVYLSFIMLYGKDQNLLKSLLEKSEENWDRLNAADCLKLSHSLSQLSDIKNNCMPQKQCGKIKELLNKATKYQLQFNTNSYLRDSTLLKAFILRNDSDDQLLESLLMKYNELEYMSSKIVENICYAALSTQSLVPELIDKCTKYVTGQNNRILGFNAEKILFLCYYLSYHPTEGDRFFDVVTNVIIRDQERSSGLAFLQAALALCYFNKLPSSFIKQIFNVEFLEKLDMELENCYSKDKYPQRVRNVLMLLNRAVCLEYPQFNVPWFHQKYVESLQKRLINYAQKNFQSRVKEYLVEALGNQHHVLENIVTPYGYHVDFAINLNSKGTTVASDSPEINRRVALLLLRQHAFTRFCIHLKGKYQLKVRHLEILGYEVAIVSFNQWNNMLYSEERLEYISKLIWPSGKNNKVDEFTR